MAFDLLEDILAFLYANSGKKEPPTPADRSLCPKCGTELEEDEESSGTRCPDCGEQSDC